mgnify:CR=1 FL=1
MEQYRGKSVSPNIAIGRIWFYEKESCQIKKREISNAALEWKRYEDARAVAKLQLQELIRKVKNEVGEIDAEIFDVHELLMEDADYNDYIRRMIEEEHVGAEYAVHAAGDYYAEMFAAMDNEYFRARSADIRDISQRLAGILTDQGKKIQQGEEPVIIVATDLMPSETVQMDRAKVLAFVTEKGSVNSHVAILARTMNIPALTAVKVRREWNGRIGIVDGSSGILYVDPDLPTLERMRRYKNREKKAAMELQKLKGMETVTQDGRQIRLYANIGNVADAEDALFQDAEGIGLFRSEFLYLEKNSLPTEEEQFESYRKVAEKMKGKRVIIRTMDIGADKQAPYLGLEKEENPAMGYRAIRICLEQQEIFRTQLRAIYRASVYGTVAVMFPMIISVEEVQEIKRQIETVKKELQSEQIPFRDIETGIMIETPAAALISDELAKEVDFFSIGTNDLSQYTLAVDRQNPRLERFFDPYHPAVLRMIRMTVENGHRGGCWVGICGELAADLTLTEEFVRMGVDELSVTPAMILPVREAVRSISVS